MKRKLLIALPVILIVLAVTGIAFALNSNDTAGDDVSTVMNPSKTTFESVAQDDGIKDTTVGIPSGSSEEISDVERTSSEEGNSFESKQIDDGTPVNNNDSNGTNSDANVSVPNEPIKTGLDGLNRDADIIFVNYYVSGAPQRVMDSHAKALALELLDAIEYRSPEELAVNGEKVAGFISVDIIVKTDKGPFEVEFISSGADWDTWVGFGTRSGDSPIYYAAPGYYHDTLHELLIYLRSS